MSARRGDLQHRTTTLGPAADVKVLAALSGNCVVRPLNLQLWKTVLCMIILSADFITAHKNLDVDHVLPTT